MAMLTALISGVLIHRKVIQEFFTFRSAKKARPSTLDVHNLTSMIGLPFHFVFPVSGLIIFVGIYFEWSLGAPCGGGIDAHYAEAYGNPRVEAQGPAKAAPVSLDALIARAASLQLVRRVALHPVRSLGIALGVLEPACRAT